ncbi:MAG: hypothetical protein KF810_02895 [Rhizobiaceae bacterium]|nr:hypothetical protein [Rhizobiaceae bacterium]
MTVFISIWAIPILLTVLVWVAAFCWPTEPTGGRDYGIGAAISVALRLCLAFTSTLLIWLLFFIALFIAGR